VRMSVYVSHIHHYIVVNVIIYKLCKKLNNIIVVGHIIFISIHGVYLMEKSLLNELIDLGLSSYEARAYITLLRLGEATAPSVAEISKIPLTRIYDVLSSLEDKGLVVIVHQRPKYYKPIDPRSALNNLISYIESRAEAEINRKKKLAKTLEKKLINIKPEEKKIAIDTFIIRGEIIIKNKAIEILDDARNIVRIAGYKPFLVLKCMELIEKLSERKLKVRVLGTLSEDCVKLFKKFNIEYRKYPFTYSSMIIADDDTILIVLNPGRENIAIFSSNEDLVKAHIEFFERLWRES